MSAASTSLLQETYQRLRCLAQTRLESERAGHTLQATALVHEAWIRLSVNHNTPQDQAGFVNAMSEIMRRVLVDHARRKLAARRGKGTAHEELDEAIPDAGPSPPGDEMLAVDDAMSALEAENPRAAALVRLRYFTGLTIEEAAAALFISVPTANRDWSVAKAILGRLISSARLE